MSGARSSVSSSSSSSSLKPTMSVVTRTPAKAAEELFNIGVLVQLILDYAHVTPGSEEESESKNFESKNYSPLTVGPTLFENRLPLITLLNHVVRGEYEEADKMLTKNLMLLLGSDTVTDYSGRVHYRRTAYQLARGAVDLDVVNEKKIQVVDGMAEMIERHFQRLSELPSFTSDEVNKIMQEQYVGQFPPDFKEKEDKRVASDRAALHKIWDVIKTASDDDCKIAHETDDKIQNHIWDETGNIKNQELHSIDQSLLKAPSEEAFEIAFNELKNYLSKNGIISKTFNFDILKAIYQFRNHLEPKVSMKSGLHHNHQLSEEADRLYMRDYALFGNRWDSPKNLLCWQKILGYTDRFLPACDGQASAQGAWYIWDGEKLRRSFKFRFGSGSYYPLLRSSGALRFGYNCATPGRLGHGWPPVFGEIISSKSIVRPPEFTGSVVPASKNRCAIM